MDSPLPRVAIAVPSGDMVHADFAMAYAQLCLASAAFPLQLITVKSSIVAQARNNGVEHASEFGADYLLFLDSDMVFPPTVLLRLVLHRKDIVGATYTRRVAPFDALGSKLAEQPAVLSGDLLEMHRIPTGCLLINMQVFDKLAKPYFASTPTIRDKSSARTTFSATGRAKPDSESGATHFSLAKSVISGKASIVFLLSPPTKSRPRRSSRWLDRELDACFATDRSGIGMRWRGLPAGLIQSSS